MHVTYDHGLVLQRGDGIPRGGAILGVSFFTDNAFYSIAFGTHTKKAKPIEMLFGLMTRAGHRYLVPDPHGECVIFGGCSLLASKRRWDCTALAKSDIDDFLVVQLNNHPILNIV